VKAIKIFLHILWAILLSLSSSIFYVIILHVLVFGILRTDAFFNCRTFISLVDTVSFNSVDTYILIGILWETDFKLMIVGSLTINEN
jgi:hypothetical protein